MLFTDEEELNAIITSQRELLHSGMTSFEFYRVAAKVVVGLRCGHTMIQAPSTQVSDFFDGDMTYPIDVKLFDGKLIVVNVTGLSSIQIGDEIISIDGISIESLTYEMGLYLSADGEGSTRRLNALSNYYLPYYLLFLATDDILDIEYINVQSGSTLNMTVSRDTPSSQEWVNLPPYESHFEDDYAVLTIREFYPYGIYTINSFYDFFNDFFTNVAQDEITHIILDIRGNGGGDPRITSRLFSYLAHTSQPYFNASSPNFYAGLKSNVPLSSPHYDGSLYTLIDGLCFSSCGHLAALLKYQAVGTFIGEETNGSYACSDSSTNYTLINTRLSLRISTMIWSVDVEGLEHGRGIMPDISISQGLEDYLAGIDTVMNRAIQEIENSIVS